MADAAGARAAERAQLGVRVRLFAAFREAAGTDRLEVPVEAGARVRDLLATLKERFPTVPLERGLVAVNRDYVGQDLALRDGDEVAFIPPVSGGA